MMMTMMMMIMMLAHIRYSIIEMNKVSTEIIHSAIPPNQLIGARTCSFFIISLTRAHAWVIKGLCRSRCVCATGHMKHPVTLFEKNRAPCHGGRFPPSFIHQ